MEHRSLRRSAAAVLALAVLVPLTAPAAAQEAPLIVRSPIPTISVAGTGEVRQEPDEATVRLGVTAQAEDAAAAQREASEIAARILAAVTALGVPESAIQTSRLVLDPVYSQPGPEERRGDRPYEPRIVAYRASNVVSVTLVDLEKVGPVIDAAVEAGANEVQGVDFRLRDDQAAHNQAVARAVANARATAAAMAAALGVELGPVLEAREGGAQVLYPQMDVRAYRLEAMDMAAPPPPPTPVSPGEVEVSARVEVTYRIAED
ncbi:MAG TPA: SIMPL domain-containing protein [Thermoanaerobaculia bacterium]|nr:SIMPL domain-containing protein [Thermoanaerobaculia bacterium]